MLVCQLSNIKKSYKTNVILENFNLEIEQGESVAIMGKSGSGKSTLLNFIGLIDRPDNGTVTLFGDDNPQKKRQYYLRSKISYLFQNFGLIDNESILQNLNVSLAYIKKSRIEKVQLIKKVLRNVGLEHLSLNQKIYTLSGGEQQRIALARTMLKPCEIILADEPTGSLDEENRDLILQLLEKEEIKKKTLIIATHDPAVSSHCKRTMNL